MVEAAWGCSASDILVRMFRTSRRRALLGSRQHRWGLRCVKAGHAIVTRGPVVAGAAGVSDDE